MKAETTLSSFTVFADDGEHCITILQRLGGRWWADVQRRYAFGWERYQAHRLESALELGALIVSTFGGAPVEDVQALRDELAIAKLKLERIEAVAARIGELVHDEYLVLPCSCGRRYHSGRAKFCGDCGTRLEFESGTKGDGR